MNAFVLAAWRFVRVFIAGAFAVVILLPAEQWWSKETLALAIGAGIVAVSKFLREKYGFDLKVL